MAKRIAAGGMPYAGKTTLAKYMQQVYGYRHASISGFIIDEYVKTLNEPWMVDARGGVRLDAADIYEGKESYRMGLQVMGDDLGLQDPERVGAVFQMVLEACGAWDHPDEPVVLEPIRGAVQAEAARALGFTIVQLDIDEYTQANRQPDGDAYMRMRMAMRARPDLEYGVSNYDVRLTSALTTPEMAKLLTILPEKGTHDGSANQPYTASPASECCNR